MEFFNESFNNYLSHGNAPLPIYEFVLNFILASIVSFLIKLVFIKYGKTLSNREYFSNNFVPLTLTTMIIITIVKSSLALSLGLVGALSIVRFRTAIKEPEELLYLFISITIGLGFGANQPIITCVGIFLLAIIIIYTRKKDLKNFQSNIMLLTVSKNNSNKIDIDSILNIINKNADEIDLKRLEYKTSSNEISFIIKLFDVKRLINIKNELNKLDSKLEVDFIDNSKFF